MAIVVASPSLRPCRRPLPCGVKYTQDANLVVGYRVVDQDVILMRHQLPRTCDATDTAKARMINQTVGLLGKEFIEGQCSARVVGLNVVIDRTAIVYSLRGPEKPQDFAWSLRRVSSLRAANSASTSSAATRRPALAESNPTWTWRRNQASCSADSCCCLTKSRMKSRKSCAPVRSRALAALENSSFKLSSTRKVKVASLIGWPHVLQ